MPKSNIIKLTHSLSRAEKRSFKLASKKHSGDKKYMDLFDLIVQKEIEDEKVLKQEFEKLHPKTSLHNTASYLSELLVDNLIQNRIKDQDIYQILYGLLKVNVLKERNLLKESYTELRKIQELSYTPGNALLQYVVIREQLNYKYTTNYKKINERELVSLQMKARQILKKIKNTHEHYSILELLKYRALQRDKILSDKEKEKLNDLLLSEMSIVNDRVKNNLESKRLHLLFQSFFFTNVGDYKSALKTYSELNLFFEKNTRLWNDPPFDYYSSLDGILDSLRTDHLFEEMNFYIQKLTNLESPQYPEYFNALIKKTILIYKLALSTHKNDTYKCVEIINSTDSTVWKTYPLIDEKKQKELLFYLALSYFKFNQIKKAEKFIRLALMTGNPNADFIILKAIRLLDLLINYEKREMVYLDYQIRSLKRRVNGQTRVLKTERLVFKVLKMDPDHNGRLKNDYLWKSIQTQIPLIERSTYEKQLLKFYNFLEWVKNKFNK